MRVQRRSNNLLLVIIFMLLVTGISLILSLFNKPISESIVETTTVINNEVTVEEENKCDISFDELPESVNNIVNEINDYYKKNDKYFAFKYVDIETGYSVSVNEHGSVSAASTIKAPAAIYLWEQARDNKINLNEQITYEENHYDNGCGVIQYKPIGTTYPTKELLNLSITISDNVAYNMLMSKYGRKNMMEFWKSKGTEEIYTKETWGNITAYDASIYMKELYNFYKEGNEYSEAAMNDFINSNKKFIKSPNNKTIANKAGWFHDTKHDVGIILDDKPYILIALSNLGSTYNGSYFKDVSDMAYRLHTEYWNYRNSKCVNKSNN